MSGYLAAAAAHLEGRELNVRFTPDAAKQIERDMNREAPKDERRAALEAAAQSVGGNPTSSGDTDHAEG
ncbi:MAG: hypothetical protein QM767_11565 [Anaeromyxobacter sp.]